ASELSKLGDTVRSAFCLRFVEFAILIQLAMPNYYLLTPPCPPLPSAPPSCTLPSPPLGGANFVEVRIMSDKGYTPPKVWTWDKENGGRFASINRPIAGPTHEKELPVGKHPMQLYSQGTPNGVKVTVLLEELLAAGHK